jgi:hypothetical protein
LKVDQRSTGGRPEVDQTESGGTPAVHRRYQSRRQLLGHGSWFSFRRSDGRSLRRSTESSCGLRALLANPIPARNPCKPRHPRLRTSQHTHTHTRLSTNRRAQRQVRMSIPRQLFIKQDKAWSTPVSAFLRYRARGGGTSCTPS